MDHAAIERELHQLKGQYSNLSPQQWAQLIAQVLAIVARFATPAPTPPAPPAS